MVTSMVTLRGHEGDIGDIFGGFGKVLGNVVNLCY